MNPFQLPQDAADSAARQALDREERPPGADPESSPKFVASFSGAKRPITAVLCLPCEASSEGLPKVFPPARWVRVLILLEGVTPLLVQPSRGRPLQEQRVRTPPTSLHLRGNVSVGVSPAAGPSNLRFGTLEPSPHLDAAPGWPQGWPANQYRPHGVVGGVPPFTAGNPTAAGNATAVGSAGQFGSLNPHAMHIPPGVS